MYFLAYYVLAIFSGPLNRPLIRLLSQPRVPLSPSPSVRPLSPGRAGLYAIFTTQSNDFALGYPILVAIYGQTHPECPAYLYLIAPISLVILNPIGFVAMEIGKNSTERTSTKQKVAGVAREGRGLEPAKKMCLLRAGAEPS